MKRAEIEHAMAQLVLSRRKSVKQGEADLVRMLREEIERARNA